MSWKQVIGLVSAICVFAIMGASQSKSVYSVSIPALKVAPGERIISLEIQIKAATVEGVTNLPLGWSFSDDNDPSWQPKIIAATIVGGASLEPADLKKLRLTVRKNEFGDLKFALSGTVSVTKNFTEERQLSLKTSDFSVSPAL
jgi:hypothetical protein